MSKTKNEVAKAEAPKNALAVATGGALAEAYAEDGKSGFENADAQSFAIPFLQILQSMSPQCKKSEGAYIKGAEEGMFYNTVTQDIASGDEGLLVIPCYYKRSFIEWAPRESGGGFKGEYLPTDPIVATAVRGDKGDVLPNGNLLVDTRTHYVLVLNEDGSFQPAVVTMSSTQVKKSRQWMSKMEGIKFKNGAGQLYTAPMYSHVYKLTTVPEKNDHGSWFGWKIEIARLQEDPMLLAAAREFKRQISAGEVREQPHQAAHGDEEVPY